MIIRQAFTLLRQNPFFSVVSIIGTAVSIAFAMVVYMVYDIQTANIRPESHRDRMVYSSYGYSYRKADHSNANTGMSYQAASRVLKICLVRNLLLIPVISPWSIVGFHRRKVVAARSVVSI